MNMKDIQISFEIEFCHHLSNNTIKRHIFWLFPGCIFISRKDRNSCSGIHNHCFTLYQDNTVDVDFGDQSVYELVTPLKYYKEAQHDLNCILRWIKETGGTTNHTTSLHVNMSYYGKEIDPLKLVLSLDEESILSTYRRKRNKFCKPHREYLKKRLQRIKHNTFDNVRHAFANIDARRPPARPYPYWFRSVYVRGGQLSSYAEFRMIGNKNYHLRYDEITKTIKKYAQAVNDSVRYDWLKANQQMKHLMKEI